MNRARRQGGFSLIEVLVVIVVIGILCAIAIPMYLGQHDKANDAAVREGGRTIAIAMQTYTIENPSGKRPADASQAVLVAAGATTNADWPKDVYHGGPMTIGTDPGQYKHRTIGGHDFEMRVYLTDGNVFVVP